jgi:hypothetical protein
MTGLLVSLVMKYADTILKGSVAVVVAAVLSIFIWNASASVDSLFVVGAVMVMLMCAVALYSKYPPVNHLQMSLA